MCSDWDRSEKSTTLRLDPMNVFFFFFWNRQNLVNWNFPDGLKIIAALPNQETKTDKTPDKDSLWTSVALRSHR